ncbi:liprin-alpha-2-like isoform X2 [Dysidea avara]|uniref:liprin-alpha-2-like isoform X2 n=1 Tax=Dysidea avara TaxID=196820 RepID=UPI003318EB4C
MCELLPPISEDVTIPDDQVLSNSKVEHLMMTMLDEKDKLMDDLQKAKEDYDKISRKLAESQADKEALLRQLKVLLPQDEVESEKLLAELRKSVNGVISDGRKKRSFAEEFAGLARDLVNAKKQMAEKEEELKDLKAERSNTRLLVEHLESLVSRHEKSLRMTVVKRQTQNTGVSSEIEVLKALKSLFDHHQALDNKVKVRLRKALERNSVLEDELMLANQEMKSLQEENRRYQRFMSQRTSMRQNSNSGGHNLFSKDQRAVLEEKEQLIGDLQFSLDERSTQLEEAMRQTDELVERVQELEDEMELMLKELHTKQQSIKSSNKHISDAVGMKRDLEAQINELQGDISREQTEVSRLRDHNSQLRNQLSDKENKQVKFEEELSHCRAEMKQLELQLSSAQEQSSTLLQQHNEILTQAEARQGTAESRVLELENELHRTKQLLASAAEKEQRNENHIETLSGTIEKMLKDSNERLAAHLAERIALTNDKDALLGKVEKLQVDVDLMTQEKCDLTNQYDFMKAENQLLRLRGSTTSLYRARSNQLLRKSWAEPELERRVSEDASFGLSSLSNTLREESVSDNESTTPPALTISSPTENHGLYGNEQGGYVTRRHRPVSGNEEMMKLQQEEEEFWQLAEGLTKPGSVELYFDMLSSRFSQIQADTEKHEDDSRATVEKSATPTTPTSTTSSSTTTQSSAPSPQERYRNVQSMIEPLPQELNFPITTASGRERPRSMETIHKLRDRTGAIGNTVTKLFRRKHYKRKSKELKQPVTVIDGGDPTSPNAVSDQLTSSGGIGSSPTSRASEKERRRKNELLDDVYRKRTPFALWDTKTVIAWLEVWVGLPSRYVSACKASIRSGAIMANMSDSEITQELCITNPLHRLKIRLAVQEMVTLTSSSNTLYRTTSLFGEMGHEWISQTWLPSLGLPQYGGYFADCLVDARMLEHLTKKDLRVMLKMVDSSHRHSLQFGIAVLKKLDYNRQVLEERRRNISGLSDILVWTNENVIQWLDSVGMEEYTLNLLHSGVHGGIVALDNTFDFEKLVMALQIPTSNTACRKRLKSEFGGLVLQGTGRVLSSPEPGPVQLVRSLSKRLKKRRFQNHSDSSVHSNSNSQSTTPRAVTPSEDSHARIVSSPDLPSVSSSVQRSNSSVSRSSSRNSSGSLRPPLIDGVTSVSL